jgi:hypothetical protein
MGLQSKEYKCIQSVSSFGDSELAAKQLLLSNKTVVKIKEVFIKDNQKNVTNSARIGAVIEITKPVSSEKSLLEEICCFFCDCCINQAEFELDTADSKYTRGKNYS